MATKREREIKNCMIKLNDGKPLPKGQGYKARKERCILAVKCQNKRNRTKYNPYAVCNASVF